MITTPQLTRIMEENIDDIPGIVVLYRVPLAQFIEAMHNIYNAGADYIDIGILKDPEGKLDELKVGYTTDYLSNEALEHMNANRKMSDDDIDNLTT